MGNSHAKPLNSGTHGYMVRATIDFHGVVMACSAWEPPKTHDCAHIVDTDRTNLMLTSPVGRARDSYGCGSC